jgi:DNA replication protein DnaC
MEAMKQDEQVNQLLMAREPSEIAELLKKLKLKYISQSFEKDILEMSPQEKTCTLKYLSQWILTENAERKAAMIAARIKSAKFRRLQTIDSFDFKHSKVTEKIEKNYLTLYQSVDAQNLPSAVFTGNAGVGKTHLARSLGFAACQKGLTVLFMTAAEMVNHLAHAQKAFNLETELNRYRRPQVLIIDELGYVSLDAQASNLFFQVISARHDAGQGTIATTNLPFGKFNQIFANDAIAHAIVDRLVNDAEVFFMEGDSYREHQRKEKTKNRNTQQA